MIDDDRISRWLIARQLRQEGLEVTEAAGGVEGIRMLCEERVDLVLTDLRMPGCSGWDVARAARQLRPNLPVVLVTGNPEMVEAVLDAAPYLCELVSAVIPKPVCPETLLRVVRTLTGALEVEKGPRGA